MAAFCGVLDVVYRKHMGCIQEVTMAAESRSPVGASEARACPAVKSRPSENLV